MTSKLDKFYTLQEGIDLVYKFIDRLAVSGFLISRDNINSINFIVLANECGNMRFADETTYDLVINKRLLNKNKFNYLQCVIYHELAHIIQHNEAIANHIIKYNKETDDIEIICKDTDLADFLIFDNYRHTRLWFDIINRINTEYNLMPKITAYLTQAELDKFLEEFFMKSRIRPNEVHVDRTVCGLTIDDMMKYDIKPEYLNTQQVEPHPITHEYRDLIKSLLDKDAENK